MYNKLISICIPTYNRYELTLESIDQVISDDRVGQVVIVDDCSTDGSYKKLVDTILNDSKYDKVFITKNSENLDCYENKRESVALTHLHWCILFDSDNVMGVDYLDKLYDIGLENWDENTIYAPVFAAPTFDYRRFEGVTITRENVKEYLDQPMFTTALNTANYFFHRDTYLQAFNPDIDPVTADSIYMAYRFLEQGKKIHFVPGLTYYHRVHRGHYQTNIHRTPQGLYEKIIENLRKL